MLKITNKKASVIKKAQTGTTTSGNSSGYARATSPLKTTPYEKKISVVGKNVVRTDGSGKVISTAPKGTRAAEQIKSAQQRDSSYTMTRRNLNKDFLNSRENIGKTANNSLADLKKGGKVKKLQTGGSLGSIHTGSAKTHPGVLKAKADKAKRDSVAVAYKANSKLKNKK